MAGVRYTKKRYTPQRDAISAQTNHCDRAHQLAYRLTTAMEPRLRWGRVLDNAGRLLTTLDQLIEAINAGRWP